jgi:GntR family transcriptional regulator of vanillate catabolism
MEPRRSQQSSVLVQTRELILRGQLAPGERVTEESLATRLGVSRTPVRQALPALALEGLLVQGETRGYLVRSFSEQDVLDAIDTRGVLEGLAGRLAVERGAGARLARQLHACLVDGDAIFESGELPADAEARYARMNGRFHHLIVEAAESRVIADALSHNGRVPFASASAVAFDHTAPDVMFDRLRFAHREHHMIARAITSGQAARVEALLREHSQLVKESLNLIKSSAPRAARRPLGPRVEMRNESIFRN